MVNITLTTNQSWNDPYDNNTPYLIWDQVDTVTPINRAITESFNVTLNVEEDFEAWASESVEDSGMFGMFSSSASSQQFFSEAVANNASWAVKYSAMDAYNVVLLEDRLLEPDPDFLYDATRLPALWWFPEKWAVWQTHFQTYGTHFVAQGNFGGGYFYSKFVDSAYVHTAAEGQFAADAQADFLSFLAADGGIAGGASAASSAYLSAGVAVVVCDGAEQLSGSCHNGHNDSAAFAKWANAIPTSPALMDVRLRLTANLVPRLLQATYLEATITYVGWVGVDALLSRASSVGQVLTHIANLTVPTCECYPAGATCTDATASKVIAQVTQAKATANKLQQTLGQLVVEMQQAVKNKTQSMVLPPAAQLANWTAIMASVAAKVYSVPVEVTCSSFILASSDTCGSGASQVCCSEPYITVYFTLLGLCDGKTCEANSSYNPKLCFSELIPVGLLS